MAPAVLAPTMAHPMGLHSHLQVHGHFAQAAPPLCWVQVIADVRQPHGQPVALVLLRVEGSYHTDLACGAVRAAGHPWVPQEVAGAGEGAWHSPVRVSMEKGCAGLGPPSRLYSRLSGG